MSQEYTHQVLKIVVAQICQTIGWHSIHSTPLELLADILHKYLQEIARQTARYTEFYGRTEPSLDDIALAFRDLNVNLSDVEEYVNNVEPVSCAIDVPRYPVHKESNLNFLKPGSKEVLTRPVHIYEYLPPIYPEKEATSEHEQNDAENSCDNVILHNNSHENDIFKKPEITENNPVYKKPRLAFEEEGRPTREISSVMMTSSGFISPAREGKLPDSKIPIIPEIKSSNRKSPSPSPSNLNSSSTQLIPLPVSSMESKFDKKIKRKSNVLGAAAGGSGEKERKREKGSSRNVTLSDTSLSTKSMNSTNHHRGGGHHHIPDKQKVLTKKKNKEKKHKDYQTNMNNVSSERSIGNNSVLNNNESSKNSKFNLNSSNINQKTDYFSQSSFNVIPANTAVIDINVKSKVDKLSAEPDKQKLNIFKKISAKKDRDDLSKSPNIYPDNQILSSIPEGTTITPAPPLIKNHSQSKVSDSEHVICLDDEPSMTISKITSNYSKLSPHQAANIISQNLEALGTTAIPTTSKPQTTRKPRKNKGHHQQQQQLEQAMPLNLSNSSPVNMVKKDILQNSKLPYSTSHKTPKGKKERKNKTKQKESKKDAQQSNVLQDFPNVKNALNPLQSVFPSTSSESHSRSDNLFLPNKDINSLNQQYRKFDSMMKQGVAPSSQPYGASNFPSIPTIPMFPFYSFPSRPGLIPSPSLFSPLPDNSSFKPYMPIIRFDFDKVNKKPRLGSKYDEDPVPLPPPLAPTEAEKGYCNVAPLVPDSMKFQLLPQKYPSTVTTSNQKSAGITPMTSTSSLYDEFGNGLSSAPMSSNFSDQSQLQHPSTSFGNMNTSNTVSGMHQKSPKFSSDTPIEISDDEKPKSDTDENISSKHGTLIDDTNLNTDKTSANSSYMDDYPCSSTAKSLKNEKSENLSPDRSIVATSSIREEKHEKRKDKEHKKGKKGKDGKIKKKKDKKDKSKNKDKTGKRKDREEKKDKDKTKKLKKEKKKEKLRAAAIYSSDDGGKQLNDSGDCSGAVPKLTLKLGLNNSPQHSPDERKMSLKNERRESSPELARISPLVTRPPKQKNLSEYTNSTSQYDESYSGGISSSSSSQNYPLPSRQSSSDKYQTQYHHQQHQHHHHHRHQNQSRNSFLLDTTTTQSSSNVTQQQYQHHGSVTNLSASNNSSNSNNNYNNKNFSGSGNNQSNYNRLHSHSSKTTAVEYSSSNLNSFYGGAVVDNTASSSRTAGSTSGRNNNATTTIIDNSGNNNTSNTSNMMMNFPISSLESSSKNNSRANNLTSIAECNRPSSYIDAEGNQVWICPACGRVDDGTPMIGCDGCDAWYHWVCVGIQVPPDDNEDWYCRVCIVKKQEAHGVDKRRKRKKKNKAN